MAIRAVIQMRRGWNTIQLVLMTAYTVSGTSGRYQTAVIRRCGIMHCLKAGGVTLCTVTTAIAGIQRRGIIHGGHTPAAIWGYQDAIHSRGRRSIKFMTVCTGVMDKYVSGINRDTICLADYVNRGMASCTFSSCISNQVQVVAFVVGNRMTCRGTVCRIALVVMVDTTHGGCIDSAGYLVTGRTDIECRIIRRSCHCCTVGEIGITISAVGSGMSGSYTVGRCIIGAAGVTEITIHPRTGVVNNIDDRFSSSTGTVAVLTAVTTPTEVVICVTAVVWIRTILFPRSMTGDTVNGA